MTQVVPDVFTRLDDVAVADVLEAITEKIMQLRVGGVDGSARSEVQRAEQRPSPQMF